MKIAVQDANILIDLELSGLLGAWFQLGIETHTTDLIVEQIRIGGHTEILANVASRRLVIHTCSAERIAKAVALAESCPGIDLEDGSIYLLAVELNAILLTGDRPLRNLARAQHVDVHGTLWMFERLLEENVLTYSAASEKLKSLMASDRYLPRAECERCLKAWKR